MLLTPSPACCNTEVASATLRPVASGTATRSGPLETLTVTVESRSTLAPALGLVDTTLPAAMVSSNTSARVTLREAAWNAAWASSNDLPRQSEMERCSGPDEYVTFTWMPGTSDSPLWSQSMTWFLGTVSLLMGLASAMSPRVVSTALAWSNDIVPRSGTARGSGPLE